MKDPKEVSKKLLQKKQEIKLNQLKTPSCFIGFDGFTDEIIQVVDQRLQNDQVSYIQTIKDFEHRIHDSINTSTNFELLTKTIKIGGNAPIFAQAILDAGHLISFAGAIGQNLIEPLFKELSKKFIHTFPLAESGKSLALEFQDGKIILGKTTSLNEVNYNNLLLQISEKQLITLLSEQDLVMSANWTMVLSMNAIWKSLLKNIIPKLTKRETPRYFFIDLADPSKRSDEDIQEAIDLMRKLNFHYEVILGLNLKETERLCKILEIPFNINYLEETATKLFNQLKIQRILIHHNQFALLKDFNNYFYFPSFYTDKPKILTGAGDNFNAGYCNGLLYGLSQEECLISALLTSGFYVKNGYSPKIEELSQFFSWL